MTSPLSLPFRFTTPHRIAAAPFGIRPTNCWVQVDEHRLVVTFGRWTLQTEIDNVIDASLTGPYSFAKTAGPPHLSFADRGVTFASNPDSGVCLRFARPVPAIAPTARLAHPGATVTVDDPDALLSWFARRRAA